MTALPKNPLEPTAARFMRDSTRKTTVEAALKDICLSVTDGDHQAPPKAETGIPFITISAMNTGEIDLSKATRFVPRSYLKKLKPERQPRLGDILYSVTGSIGIAAPVLSTDPFVFQRHIAILRPDPSQVRSEYLRYILLSPQIYAQAEACATGTAQLTIPLRGLRDFTCPLPPLPEQRRIVRKLDTLSVRTATARTHLTAIEKLVQRYKLAVLSRTLFRDEMPVKRLGDVLMDIRYGTAAKCSYDPTGTPVLRIPNIQAGRIDRSDLKTAHFAKKEIEQLALRAGDILVIRSNGSPDLVGRVALVTERETDCLFAGYLIRLRLSATEALPEYVRLCFESDEVRAIIEAASKSTSGVNNVNSTQLKEIELPLPSVDEQCEIVHRIETAFAKIDRLASEAAKAVKLLGHLDQRILAKAFAGELVPQDPTDEPAEALLARIRAARAATPKPKRGRKVRA